MENNFYEILRNKLKKIVIDNGLLSEDIIITGNILSPNEAIGNTKRKDFPIIKGKERLLQADFKGAKGQAFTDVPKSFEGKLEDVLNLDLNINENVAIFIATLNAICRYLNLCENTIHCKDDDPEVCSEKLVKYIKDKYNNPKIAFVGFQPAMIEKLSKSFQIRVVDLNVENIGKIKYDVLIEDGKTKIDDLIEWCDIVIATGSTAANKTITDCLTKKPVVFYGTTIAAVAALMGYERFCACSK